MIFRNKNNRQVASIVDEELIKQYNEDANWEVGTEEDLPKQEVIQLSYGELVTQEIHKRYSIDDEIALINNKDTHPDEYAIYQQYRAECKQKVKEMKV